MNATKVLVLFLLCLFGGLYIWKFEQGPAGDESGGHTSTVPLFSDIDASAINDILFTWPDKSFEIKKNDTPVDGRRETVWLTVTPPGAETDLRNVRQVLSTLASLSSEHVLSPQDRDSEGFGLNAPVLTVKFTTASKSKTIAFGKKHAFSGRRYMQILEDDRVYLIDESAYSAINKEPRDLRYRTPLGFSVAKAKLIRVSRHDGTSLQFEQRSNQWFSTGGGREFPIDSALVTRTLENLAKLEVKNFVDSPKNLAIYGLAPPKLSVQVSFSDESVAPVLFSIGEVETAASKPEVDGVTRSMYIKKGGSAAVFEFERRFYSDLLQPAESFRDKLVFRKIDPKTIAEIQVKGNHKHFSLVRAMVSGEKGASWQLKGDTGVEVAVDPKKVEKFLDTIRNLSVVSFPVVGSDTIGEIKTVVTVLSREAETSGEWSLGIGEKISSGVTSTDGIESSATTDAPQYGFISSGPETVSVVLSSGDVKRLSELWSSLESKAEPTS